MSFLQGFAEAATDKWEKEAETEQKKEAWKFQTDYRMSQQNIQVEKQRDAAASKSEKAGREIAKMYGHGVSVQNTLGEAMRNGMPYEQALAMAKSSDGSWQTESIDPEMAREMKSLAGNKAPEAMSSNTRVNSTPEEVSHSENIANGAAVIANKIGGNAKQIARDIGGLVATDGSEFLRAVFKPNDNQLQKTVESWPNDAEKLSIIAAKYDQLGTSKGDRYAEHARNIINTIGKDHNISDGEGFIQQEDGNYLKGSYRNGEFYADGEDKPMSPDAIEGTFFNSSDGLTSEERTSLTKVMTPIRDMTTSLKTSIRDRAKAADIVSQHPDALTTVTSVMGGVQSFAVEMNSALKVVGGIVTNSKEWEATWNKKVNKFLANDAFDAVPGARELSRIQFRLAFAELRAEGQTGRSISNKDVDRVLNNLFPSNPENFGPHMAKGFASQLQKVQDAHNAFVNDYGDLLAKSSTHGYRLTDSIMEQMKRRESDESYLRGVELLEGYLEEADGTYKIDRENKEAISKEVIKTEEVTTNTAYDPKKDGPTDAHLQALRDNRDNPVWVASFEKNFGLKAADFLDNVPSFK
jgi:hypothetical protein